MEATEYEFRIFAENETGWSRPQRTPVGIKTKLSGEFKPLPLHRYLLTVVSNVTSVFTVTYLIKEHHL